jgi:hypothetical protein
MAAAGEIWLFSRHIETSDADKPSDESSKSLSINNLLGMFRAPERRHES